MDISCEPMDIDLSSNSIKNMDVSYCESEEPMRSRSASPFEVTNFLQAFNTQEPVTENVSPVTESVNEINGFQNVKKYHIIMQNKKQSSKFLLNLSIVLVLFGSVIFYHLISFDCREELDIQLIKVSLSQNLYGQNKAIDKLTTSLDTKASSKILFLLGGTGVGKTYAISLMLEVWNSSNVYHYIMPTFLETFPNDFLIGMSLCKSSILILDDLTHNDMNIIEHIERVIEKNEYLKKNITVILIYNLDSIENGFTKSSDAAFFELELRDYFSHIDAYKEYIRFETLTDEHLEMCIKTGLGRSNVANINLIMKNFNVTLDGCKGVHTKMKLLNLM